MNGKLDSKWIRPNMVLNIPDFGLESGHLRREKRRGEEEKERRRRRRKKERREEEAFKVWILVKELYGICVWICMEFMWG